MRTRLESTSVGDRLLTIIVAFLVTTSVLVGPVAFAGTATATSGEAGASEDGDVASVRADPGAAPRDSLEAIGAPGETSNLAAVVPPDFSSSTFLSGVNQPMAMTFLPDGRMLLIEKPGTVEITDPDDGTKDTATYLDITGQVDDGRERGLIDVTLDPNFEQNGYVYLFYSNDANQKNRIARFTHQENGGGLQSSADPQSEFLVWEETTQWDSCCHQGAGLDFGPDGKLWATMGDDFHGGAVSQDLSRSGGKVIRVNKDGSIPQDNPYVDDGDPNTLGEIWADGVRNPFRAEWDIESGRFFFGDVGGNSAPDYEEVNVATLDDGGADYGWPACEGTSKSNEDAPCDVSQKAPLYSYPHSEGNSITGGEVYRGGQFPDEYQGAYFFGDYAKDWIKYLMFDSNGNVQDVGMFEDSANSVAHITTGPDGSLYWASISDGTIHKVDYTGNQAPQIDSVSATPTSATSAPQTIDFSVSASDPEDDSLTYAWTFGDGSTGSGASTSHTYQSEGVYTAYVEVSDGTTTIESRPIGITIGEAPTVAIDSPSDGMLFRAGDTVSFSASASDPQDGALSSDAFSWDVVFDHNPPEGADHDHPVVSDYQGASGSFDVPTSGHGYSTDTSYTLTVTATDSDGLSASDSVTIEPDKVDVTFDTEPEGLDVTVDGLPVNDGTVYDTLIGFQHAVSAPQTQCLDGREYEFEGWSDGGARSHDYTVPTAAATLTATYQDVGECSAPVTDGLVAQFETDQGLSTSGEQVTGWADQSGQGNDLTAVGDPTTTTAPSGQSAISFDGDGDKLERTGALNGLPSGNGDRSVFFVANYQSTGYGGFAFGDDDSNQAFGTVVNPGGDLMVQAWGSSNDFGSGVAGTGEGWVIQSATLESSALTHYKDGQVIDTRTHSYGTDIQQMILGAEIDSNPYLDMEVAAALVYDRALSDTERQQVESYLQEKYLAQGASNQSPTASDDSATVDAGGAVTAEVLANDKDPDGTLDASSVTIDQGPSHGTATVNADGTITYSHDGSDTTSDSFVYTVTDDQGAGDAATVSISVDQGTGGSSVPVQSGLVTHFAADQGITAGTGDVITGWADQSGQGNDLTAIGDPLVKHDTLAGKPVVSFDGTDDLLQRTDALNGLPSGNGDRTVMYVVNYQSSPSWGGGVTYGAAACNDAFGLIVHEGVLQVQGWCEDFTADASAEVGADGWMTHSAVLAADQVTHFKDGQQIDQYTHSYATDPQKLVVGAEIDGSPQVDMEVAEVLIYDRALSETERQQVESYFEGKYFTQNAVPTASDDSASVTAGGSTTVDVLANDEDSDGTLDPASVQVTSGPSSGSTSIDPSTGEITYAHDGSATTSDSFTYSVADDDGATGTATVTVSVEAGDMTVMEAVASQNAPEDQIDQQEIQQAINWWATDTEVPNTGGETISQPEIQQLINTWATGAIVDGDQPTIDLLAPNEGETITGDSVTVSWETQEMGDTDHVHVYLDGANRQGSQPQDGSYTYTGVAPGDHTATVVAAMSDHTEYTNPGATETVSFTVEAGDTGSPLPVTGGLATHLEADRGVTTSNGQVTGWTDQSGTGIDLSTSGDPQLQPDVLNGNPVISLDGTDDKLVRTADLTGLPSADQDRTMFVVTKYDSTDAYVGAVFGNGDGNQAFGTVVETGGQLTVQGWGHQNDLVSDAPGVGAGWLVQSATVSGDQVTHYEGGAQIDSGTHTYATTLDAPSSKFVIGEEIAEIGYADMEIAAVLVYDRALSETERQEIEGYLQEKYLGTTGGDTNQPPTAGDDSASVTAGQSETVDVLSNDDDPDGSLDASSVQVTSQPAAGTVSVNQDGTITYDAPSTASGEVAFAYTVADDDGAISNEATVTMTVEEANQAPSTSDDTASVTAGQSTTIDVLANDGDSDGTLDASSVQITSQPSSGSASVDSSTGEITYTHDGSATTSDSFTYTVADDDGATGTATVSVTVNQPASPLPVASGLVTHLEADQGVTTSNGQVTGWTDQSGTGIDLSTSGDPQLQPDVLNGNPVISLDGDGDKLVRTEGLTGLPSADQDRTMFVVTKYDNANAWAGTAFGNGASNEAFGLVVKGGDGALTVQGWGNDLVSVTQGSGAGWTTQSAVVASGQVTHYKDGTQIDSGSKTYDTTLDAQDSKLVIGEEIAGNGYNDMEVAAVLVYDRALSETERQQVEGYLQEKYFGATNEAPSASDDSASVTTGDSVTIDVLANDGDSDGSLDPASVQVTSGPSSGSTSVDSSTGEITYTNDGSDTSTDSFTYTVADDDGATSNEATVSVTVNQPTGSSLVTDGLVTHLEADQGVTTSNGQVTGWTDQSGTGIDLAASGDPQLQPDVLNGNPVISLDGTDDKLVRTADLTGLPSADQDRTMFVVTKYDGAGAWAGTAFGNGASNEAFGLVVNGGSGKLTVQGWGTGNDLVSDAQGIGAGWLVQSAVVASNQVTHYEGGTQIDSGTRAYATNLQTFVIGEEIAGAGYADMEVAAVLVYDRALSDQERQQVEDYLDEKYGPSG